MLRIAEPEGVASTVCARGNRIGTKTKATAQLLNSLIRTEVNAHEDSRCNAYGTPLITRFR
jgi:hypothetical protein